MSTIIVYDTSTFQVVEKYERRLLEKDYQHPGEIGDVFLTNDAFYGPDGNTIYDELRVIVDGKVTRIVKPVELLPEGYRQQLQSLERVNPDTGRRYLLCCHAIGGAQSKVLLMVGSVLPKPGTSKGGIFTYDFTTGQFSPPVLTSSPATMDVLQVVSWLPNARLTPDARHILLEMHDWRPKEGARKDGAYKTGEFILYEVASGQEIRRIQKPELAGFYSGLVAIAPDSSFMYYMKDYRLYAVNLLNPEAPASRVLPEDLETYWSVLFADR
ncbi:MAG: hypothetical protein HY731_12105 [Candidatus Tectomicrobia bacterium]|nr:hypothetical protein [Candidatus Tectomicrobia bacterium]